MINFIMKQYPANENMSNIIKYIENNNLFQKADFLFEKSKSVFDDIYINESKITSPRFPNNLGELKINIPILNTSSHNFVYEIEQKLIKHPEYGEGIALTKGKPIFENEKELRKILKLREDISVLLQNYCTLTHEEISSKFIIDNIDLDKKIKTRLHINSYIFEIEQSSSLREHTIFSKDGLIHGRSFINDTYSKVFKLLKLDENAPDIEYQLFSNNVERHLINMDYYCSKYIWYKGPHLLMLPYVILTIKIYDYSYTKKQI